MFDTMTMTKLTGGFCGALLVFLLGKWVAEEVYHSGGHGHGDHHDQAYTIPVEGADDHGGEPEPVIPFADLYAAADAGEGQGVFRACQGCHSLAEGDNGTGPYLYGVVGRDVGSADGYGYSGALVAVNDVWTAEELNLFLENPKGYAPGTAMSSYSGMRDPEDRADLIAFLDSLDD